MTTPAAPMPQADQPLTRQALKTPRAAAVAGILFAVLFVASIGMMRLAIPESLTGQDANLWLEHSSESVRFALMLVPFAGIAFLWFMGVIRDRLGQFEDQFFSTVFFGSGLLFLAMIFCSAALAGGILTSYSLAPDMVRESGVLTFGRAVIFTIMNIYAIRMAGVFMLSLGTIWIRTRVMPRVLVYLTYLLAIILLVAINVSSWTIMIFPAWVFTISVYILLAALRRKAA